MIREGKPGSHWTRSEMIEHLWKLGGRLGRVPGMEDVAPYQNTAVRLFGSIAAAQRAAGFQPRRVGRPRRDA
jgi:hypothetical protein